MQAVLLPDSAAFLDKALSFPKADFLTFDTASVLSIQAMSADMSQMTLVKIEPSFFEEYKQRHMSISIPFIRFFCPGMKRLEIAQCEKFTIFNYQFEGYRLKRKVFNLQVEKYDIEFVPEGTIRTDLQSIKDLLSGVKSKDLKIEAYQRRMGLLYGKTTAEIGCDAKSERKLAFTVGLEGFRSAIANINRFYDVSLVVGEGQTALNIIQRGVGIFLSTFLSADPVEEG